MKKLSLIFLTLFLCYSFGSAKEFKRVNESELQLQTKAYSTFVENIGQWDNQVRYLTRTEGLNAWITSNGVVYDFFTFVDGVDGPQMEYDPNVDPAILNTSIKGHVVNMKFLSNSKSEFSGNGLKKTYYNYFIGNDPSKWASKVPLFTNISVSNVFDGIDAVYYYENTGLRYDIIVNPNANPDQIKMQFEGADGISINEKGDLVFSTSIGDRSQCKLFAYQEINGEKKQIECSFKIEGKDVVSFNLGEYNKNLPLIIDPLIYATYLGGNNFDAAYSCNVNDGFLYIAGGTMSPDFPVTPGAYKTTIGASMECYITKMDYSGTDLVFSTFLGASSYDMSYGIDFDSDGNIYTAGYVQSTDFPTTPGVFDTDNSGSMDAFITKFDPECTELIYSTYFGGSGYDAANMCIVADDNTCYVGGFAGSSDLPTTSMGGILQATYGGGTYDGFVVRINANATAIIRCTYIGGTGNDTQQGLALDSDGYVYTCGWTDNATFPVTENAFQTTYGGVKDGTLCKLTPDMSAFVYSTFIGGADDDQLRFMVIDTSNYSYLVGSTKSTDYPITEGALQTIFGGGTNNDGIITKVDSSGTSLVFSTYIGGPLAENTRCIVLNDNNEVFATGTTSWTDFPVTPDAQQTTIAGNTDAFLIKLNTDGTNLLYSTFFGGTLADGGGVLGYDGEGNVLMTASTVSTDFPITEGCFQNYFAGGSYDVIAAKFEIDPDLPSPLLLAPPNRTIFITTEPLLEWRSVPVAVAYDMQVSTVSNFSTTVIDLSSLTDTTYQIPEPLNETTKYYWHVRSRDAEGNLSSWSNAWNFTTQGPIAAPILVSPENESIDQILKLNCVWNSTLLATLYQFQLSSSEDFSTTLFDINQAGTTYLVDGLTINSTYYWRVRGYNDFATSDWSEVWSFETGNFTFVGTGTSYQTSTTGFTTPSPYSNYYQHGRIQFIYRATELIDAGAFPGNIKGLAWNVAVLGTVGPLYEGQYTIKMKLTNAELINAWDYEDWTTVWEPDSAFDAKLGWNMHEFTEPFYWDGVSNIRIETCYNHPGVTTTFQNPSVYYTPTTFNSTGYRTNSTDNPELCNIVEPNAPIVGVNRANTLFNFELMPLMPPTPLQPENNALNVAVLPLFDWTDVSNAVSYQIQVATNPDFEPTVIDETEIELSEFQVATPLEETTQYYWRARAYDSEGNSSYWSYKWGFITEGPIDAPILTSPVNYLEIAPTSPIYYWEAVFAATDYNLQVSDTDDFSNLIVDASINTTSYVSTVDLDNATIYYWRVMANNEFVNSEWSEVWEFTTGNFTTYGTATTYYASGGNPPGPYGNVWGGVKNQVLITRDELVAAGAIPGDITALALNVFATNNCDPLQNFAIKLKHTNVNVLSVWDYEGFTDVYLRDIYNPTVGWNVHVFDNPFYWDGGSNIIVDFCFNNLTYSTNASVYYSTTPVVQDISYWQDGELTLCSAPGNPNLLTTRPNIKLNSEYQEFLPPVPVSPEHLSLGVSVRPTFTWEPAENVLGYELAVSEFPDFSIPVFTVDGITNTYYEVPLIDELSETTVYYWRLRAYNSIGEVTNWSLRFKFITEGPLSTPILTQPLNGMTEVPTIPTFNWLEVLAATYYRLQCSTTPDFSENVLIDNIVNTNSLTGIGIPLSAEYYWRVKAGNPFTESDWSEVWSFITGSDVTLGAGTTSNLYYQWPAVYGNYSQATKNQILYRADEIMNSGGLPGQIYSIAFNVANVNTCGPLTNFTIKMKNTTTDVITTTWDLNDLTEVFFTESYQPVAGWNVHEFPTPFVWDGVSNILVDICFNNSPTAATQNASNYYTATSYNSVRYYNANNNTTLCSNPTSATVVANRPNARFTFGTVNPLLNTPVLIAPELAETGVTIIPAFDWSNILDADSYNIQVSTNASFSNLVVNETTTESDYTGSNLNYLTQYYWRVKAMSETNYSRWTPTWHFTTEEMIPLATPVLTAPENGSLNMTVALNLSWLTVEEATYYDILVSTDADFTNVFLNLESDFTNIDIEGLDYETQYFWKVKALNDIGRMSDWSEVWNFTTEQLAEFMDIQLNSGWNMISSYVIPEEPLMPTVFANIITDVNIVKNGAGQMFDPAFSINTIGDWNIDHGYLVNVDNDNTLTITGEKIIPENHLIELYNGWNLASYLRDNEMQPDLALVSLASSITLVKNNVGGLYMPAYGINTLGSMQPGEGYYFYMNQAAVLTYPANSSRKVIEQNSLTPSAKQLIPDFKNTGKNATLLLNIDDSFNGSEIGIFNSNNELIGSGAIHNGIAAISIWGDDEITQNIDGAKEFELLYAVLLNTSTNKAFNLSLNDIKEITNEAELVNLVYITNAIYLAKASVVENTNSNSIAAVPNPASNSTVFNINFVDETNAEIQIYSVTGELVGSISSNNYSAGSHKVSFDASNLSNGMYNVVLRFGNEIATTKMIIQK